MPDVQPMLPACILLVLVNPTENPTDSERRRDATNVTRLIFFLGNLSIAATTMSATDIDEIDYSDIEAK
jgi:hypothetical protein